MHLMTLHDINLRKRDVQVSNLESEEHDLLQQKMQSQNFY
jgi:hypothetical protein